ncbi:MAG: resolvase [Deltaproteobacteria bacterium]|nr:resolvase [Deltaproteobacteria bacterium]
MQYNSVIDSNGHVKLVCERRWNEALENLKQVEARHRSPTASAPAMTEDAWSELMTLCQDVTAIVEAPTTDPRDRKELLRTCIDSVFVEERTRDFIRARIAWADGTPDTPIEVKLPGHTYTLITAWAAEGFSPSAIARKLNAQGLVNKLGRTHFVHYPKRGV